MTRGIKLHQRLLSRITMVPPYPYLPFTRRGERSYGLRADYTCRNCARIRRMDSGQSAADARLTHLAAVLPPHASVNCVATADQGGRRIAVCTVLHRPRVPPQHAISLRAIC